MSSLKLRGGEHRCAYKAPFNNRTTTQTAVVMCVPYIVATIITATASASHISFEMAPDHATSLLIYKINKKKIHHANSQENIFHSFKY